MADTALLFFIGMAGVLALWRFAAWLYPPTNVWVVPGVMVVSWLAAALVVVAAIIAFPT